jgi:hypothetical protein
MKIFPRFLPLLLLVSLVGCSSGVPFYCDWRACLFLPACRSLELFTDEYRVRLADQLPRVQFYLSRDLLLVREMSMTEEVIDTPSHRVRIEKDRRILEIKIPAGTPGVLREAGEEILWVAFEDWGDGLRRRLPFRRTPLRPDKADASDPANFIYQLNVPAVRYEGERFETRFVREGVAVTRDDVAVFAPADAAADGEHRVRRTFYPALMIDLFQREMFRRERRTADGVRVGE